MVSFVPFQETFICGRLDCSLDGMPLAGSLHDLDADGSLRAQLV